MATITSPAAERRTALDYLYRIGDGVWVATCGILLGALYFPDGLRGASPVHGFLTLLCAVGTLLVFPAFGLYDSWRGRSRAVLALRVLAARSGLCRRPGGSLPDAPDRPVSRLWSLGWFASVAWVLVLTRVIAFRMLASVRELGINAKRVVIIGYGPLGHELFQRVLLARIPAIAWSASTTRARGRCRAASQPCIPWRTYAPSCAPGRQEIWLTLPMAACRDLYDVVRHFRNTVDIRWVPDIMSVELLGHRFSEFLGLPVIDLNSPPVSGITGTLKSGFDRVFAAAALLGLSPLLLLIALLVKLTSPGPVLFCQTRLGMDGRAFEVYSSAPCACMPTTASRRRCRATRA